MKPIMEKSIFHALFLCCICFFKNSHANVILADANVDDEFLRNHYIGMDEEFKGVAEKLIKVVLPIVLKATEHVNISSSCQTQMLKIMTGVRNMESWALSFPDASGKLVDGLLSGNTQMLGNYDQCLRSRLYSENDTVDFQGRYCLIHYKPFVPSPETIPSTKERLEKVMRAAGGVSDVIYFYLMKSVYLFFYDEKFGLCVPSGCNSEEIGHLVEYFGEKIHLDTTVHYCHTEEDVPYFTQRKIIVICIFGLLGLLAVTGTLFDYFASMKNIKTTGVAARILLCFSVTKNFSKVVDIKVSDKSLTCMNGIRVLTLFHIMIGHFYCAMNLFYSHTNILTLLQGLQGFFAQIVLNGFLSVEVFFFISGLLNCYSRIKAKNNGRQNPSFIWLIIHRLWRIYPAYVFAILVSFLFTARGPMGQDLEMKVIENCAQGWWKNLIFINNFYSQQSMCILQSWYIACDMQLFLLSLVTVPLLMNGSKKGIIVNSAVIFIGLLFTTVWCYINKIPPTFMFSQPEGSELLAVSFNYNAPYTHVAPYFIGILFGYVLATNKDIHISKLQLLIGWTVAGFCFTSMLFMTQRWNSGEEYIRLEAAFYFAFSKPVYIMGAAWIIFCSSQGHGGIINYILSLKIWIPLSRISFMLYLTSFTLQLFYRANARTTEDAHYMIIIWHYLGDITVCCLFALAMVVLAESPFISLEKIAFSSKLSRKEELSQDNEKSIESADASKNYEKELDSQTRF